MSDDSGRTIRLCHIVKWAHFDGYGFNLHAEKGKPGQYIGKVDEGSPAEAAGLKEGDRIIEVNGVNIANENHKQVVQRIKTVAEETKLLVVDVEADTYFKSKNIVINSDLSNVLYLRTPNPKLSNGSEENGIANNGSCIELEVSVYRGYIYGVVVLQVRTLLGAMWNARSHNIHLLLTISVGGLPFRKFSAVR